MRLVLHVSALMLVLRTSNNTLCATSLLDEYQDVVGTLSIDNIVSQLPMLLTGQVPNIPTYITCSDCVKQAYNVLMANQPDVASQSIVTSTLQGQCGSDFTGVYFFSFSGSNWKTQQHYRWHNTHRYCRRYRLCGSKSL